MSEYHKKYYIKNKEKIIRKLESRIGKLGSKKREEHNKRTREYYQKNIVRLRKQIAERQRKYNATNPRVFSDNPIAIYQRNARKEFKKKHGISSNQIINNGRNALLAVKKAKRKCEKCGSSENLQIHHKDRKGRNYKNKGLKPNNNLNNLIVLCRSCHAILHGRIKGGDSK